MIIKTYRMRLTLVLSSCFSLLFLFSLLVVYREYKLKLYETVDLALIRSAKATAESKVDANHLNRDQEIITRFGDDFHQIAPRNGTAVVGSLSSMTQKWPVSMEKLQGALSGKPGYDTVNNKGEKFRVLYYPVGKSQVLRTGATLDDIVKQLAEIRRLAVFLPAFIIGISFMGSWLLAGYAVAPAVKLRRRAEEIMRNKTAEKIDIGSKGKEIDGLVLVINTMIENIHTSVDAHMRFTSDVAHEIRSPLTSLIGNTEVTLRKKRSPEEYEELLRLNLADMMRLSRITDNILFLSRADNQIIELRKQRFDLKQFLVNIVERFAFKAGQNGIVLTEQYDKHRVELYGDMNLLEQAFSNLIENALKYTVGGGKVTVRATRDETEIRVAINDTGVGIPEEDLQHIFDRFYRVETEHARPTGTGLGLSITQWIIAANNGKIYVKSKVGEGSEFTVVFPVEGPRQ